MNREESQYQNSILIFRECDRDVVLPTRCRFSWSFDECLTTTVSVLDAFSCFQKRTRFTYLSFFCSREIASFVSLGWRFDLSFVVCFENLCCGCRLEKDCVLCCDPIRQKQRLPTVGFDCIPVSQNFGVKSSSASLRTHDRRFLSDLFS